MSPLRGSELMPSTEYIPVFGRIRGMFLSLAVSGKGSGFSGHPQGW